MRAFGKSALRIVCKKTRSDKLGHLLGSDARACVEAPHMVAQMINHSWIDRLCKYMRACFPRVNYAFYFKCRQIIRFLVTLRWLTPRKPHLVSLRNGIVRRVDRAIVGFLLGPMALEYYGVEKVNVAVENRKSARVIAALIFSVFNSVCWNSVGLP